VRMAAFGKDERQQWVNFSPTRTRHWRRLAPIHCRTGSAKSGSRGPAKTLTIASNTLPQTERDTGDPCLQTIILAKLNSSN
jgi:hypothetical protein